MLFRRILLAALLSGVIAGGALGLLQLVTTLPIIHAAEAYEHQPDSVLTHSQESVSPRSGLQRNLYSVGATIIIACAYALILQSVMSLSGRANPRNGVLWGLAGYLVFFAVPALGLAPEIPGLHGDSLEHRQSWWLFSSSTTAAGLAMLAFGRNWIRLLAIPVLLFPFVFVLPESSIPVPGESANETVIALVGLQQDFMVATAATLALFWILLGVISGFVCARYFSCRQPANET